MNKDFHYYGTYYAARLAGYSREDAEEIAWAAQMVDDFTESNFGRMFHRENITYTCEALSETAYHELGRLSNVNNSELQKIRRIWVPFHFLPGNMKERVRILNELRNGDFDCIVGINLLREGIDMPELRLVAILDADKEGFLRSTRSLIQVAGRAARNVDGYVILYADQITDSMQALINITNARRERQQQYNQEHKIIPRSVAGKKDRETITEVLGISSKTGAYLAGDQDRLEQIRTDALAARERRAKYTASDGSGYSEKESAKKSKGRKQRNVPDIATLLEKTGANSLDEIIAELAQVLE